MQINLPQVGESVTEGVISQWLRKIGDHIEKYDPLVEVVTDKVTMEMPSPVSGTLSSILVENGQTVPMGAPIAHIETDSPQRCSSEYSPSGDQTTPLGTMDRTGTLLTDVAPVGPTGSGGPANPSKGDGGSSTFQRYSPAVMRLAAEHNVQLDSVRGTGINGRITRKDVQSYIAGLGANESKSSGDVRRSLTPVRRIIANNMARSSREIPEAWTMMEVDVTGLVEVREDMKDVFRESEGVPLTYLPFILNVVAESLKIHQLVNASWDGDSIIIKGSVNIGVAIASPEGLFVPVVHNADTLDVTGIAKILDLLATKTKSGTLSMSEVHGATFTVNNTGALGSVSGKAIINYPQAAILNTEAIVRRPVVVGEVVTIRSMMNLCLTFDHRVLDGLDATEFLSDVKRRLESIASPTETV